jgi:hypothetical protein
MARIENMVSMANLNIPERAYASRFLPPFTPWFRSLVSQTAPEN